MGTMVYNPKEREAENQHSAQPYRLFFESRRFVDNAIDIHSSPY